MGQGTKESQSIKLYQYIDIKPLVFISMLILSGCGLFVANYDTTEYYLVNHIRTQAMIGNCSKENVDTIYKTSTELVNFTQYLPRNEPTHEMAQNLHIIVDELRKRESPGVTYCKNKLNIISTSAEEIQRVVGKKPK